MTPETLEQLADACGLLAAFEAVDDALSCGDDLATRLATRPAGWAVAPAPWLWRLARRRWWRLRPRAWWDDDAAPSAGVWDSAGPLALLQSLGVEVGAELDRFASELARLAEETRRVAEQRRLFAEAGRQARALLELLAGAPTVGRDFSDATGAVPEARAALNRLETWSSCFSGLSTARRPGLAPARRAVVRRLARVCDTHWTIAAGLVARAGGEPLPTPCVGAFVLAALRSRVEVGPRFERLVRSVLRRR